MVESPSVLQVGVPSLKIIIWVIIDDFILKVGPASIILFPKTKLTKQRVLTKRPSHIEGRFSRVYFPAQISII